ncbi:MAG: flagellar biosynthesis anti-sigma factor FlgM [Hahellaceae bacterium]|nr:flagellar biosynthesis anti-sigma factor FlgM [Hahellaceae bacterium]
MPIEFNGLGHTQNTRTRNLDVSQSQSKQAVANTEKATPGSEVQPRGENLVLSDKAKALKDIEVGLKNKPDVDSEKVARIKAALEDGSYDVNPKRLAQKMLDFDKSIF